MVREMNVGICFVWLVKENIQYCYTTEKEFQIPSRWYIPIPIRWYIPNSNSVIYRDIYRYIICLGRGVHYFMKQSVAKCHNGPTAAEWGIRLCPKVTFHWQGCKSPFRRWTLAIKGEILLFICCLHPSNIQSHIKTSTDLWQWALMAVL